MAEEQEAQTDLIKIEDQFYILATSARVDDRTRVLKHGETFALFDRLGDIYPVGLGEQGMYHAGTRFLSRLELWFGKQRPLLLSSTMKDDNALLAVDLTNPDVSQDGTIVMPRGTLHIFRTKFLWEGSCYERLRVSNFGRTPVDVVLRFLFGGDFADVFEVRGARRAHRGRVFEGRVEKGVVVLAYEGLDGTVRRTRIAASPEPTALSASEVEFAARLAPQADETFYLTVTCEAGTRRPAPVQYERAFRKASSALARARERGCSIHTSNEQFNDWLNRSAADLHMLITDTSEGPYPYAGVPWYSTAFGRDGIITALEYLWVDPTVAQGVLSYLARTQADEESAERDAEPGKILHETRQGEMAALGEIPFARYYGSVDATPLFLVLAGAYYERTGDRPFIQRIWPNIERALGWIDRCGDLDGDGFVEYLSHSPRGLLNHGWRDSSDAVFHADGRIAQGAIALCEIQGYVYAGKQAVARLATALGDGVRGAALRQEVERLRSRFEEVFWCEELGSYVLALDGQKRQCQVRVSNVGHLLFAGIVSDDRARRIAEVLLSEDYYSGWGIRTVAMSEMRYNPMSYHNGSVWPHDNALIAQGFARYGLKDETVRLLTALFDASLFVELHRLPELYCGFARRPGEGPTLYPVACMPQAWAAASPYLLLQSCLGLTIDGAEHRVCFMRPILPPFLETVWIKDLRVGAAAVDLQIVRHGDDVGITIVRREGDLGVTVLK